MGPKTLGALLLGLCLLLAGCVPSLDEKLTREGIGSDLYAADLADETRLQNEYFKFICMQAGAGPQGETCADEDLSPKQWRAVITAGMNDIDRRCDSYLAWLDNKKRSQQPLLNEVSDIGNATHSIMSITGSGPQALEIISTAFGLLRSSLVNYHSRLLLEVESSTVNTIVLTKRNGFRNEIREKAIGNRPDAVYAIRAYLRICLPFTIETDINDLSSLQVRGVSDRDVPSVTSGEESLPDTPAVTPSTPTFAPVQRAKDRVAPTPAIPREEAPSGAETQFELQLKPTDVKAMQSVLCVPTDGAFGLVTRRAIRVFETVEGAPAPDGKLDEREGGLLLSKSACNISFSNYFERDRLTAPMSVEILKRRINTLLPAAGKKLDVNAKFPTQEIRVAISDLKTLCKVENSLQLPDEEVTPEFLRRVGFSKKDSDQIEPCTSSTPQP